jgi:hypothetical protein
MALQMDYLVEAGESAEGIDAQYAENSSVVLAEDFTIRGAYIKVKTVRGDKTSIRALVSICSSQGGTEVLVKQYSFVPDMDGENFIRQSYLHLKTLDEYSTAEDV